MENTIWYGKVDLLTCKWKEFYAFEIFIQCNIHDYMGTEHLQV